jgi:hypothetical protein
MNYRIRYEAQKMALNTRFEVSQPQVMAAIGEWLKEVRLEIPLTVALEGTIRGSRPPCSRIKPHAYRGAFEDMVTKVAIRLGVSRPAATEETVLDERSLTTIGLTERLDGGTVTHTIAEAQESVGSKVTLIEVMKVGGVFREASFLVYSGPGLLLERTSESSVLFAAGRADKVAHMFGQEDFTVECDGHTLRYER